MFYQLWSSSLCFGAPINGFEKFDRRPICIYIYIHIYIIYICIYIYILYIYIVYIYIYYICIYIYIYIYILVSCHLLYGRLAAIDFVTSPFLPPWHVLFSLQPITIDNRYYTIRDYCNLVLSAILNYDTPFLWIFTRTQSHGLQFRNKETH